MPFPPLHLLMGTQAVRHTGLATATQLLQCPALFNQHLSELWLARMQLWEWPSMNQ